jgi:hypothetical protein
VSRGGAPSLSLGFTEWLTGWYRDGLGRQRPLQLEVQGASKPGMGLREFVATGTLSADGLVATAALTGTVSFVSEAGRVWTLRYDLASSVPQGLRLVATKRDLAGAPYAAFTTLRGEIFDTERVQLLAPFAARFDARGDVGRWLRSVSLRRV